MVGVLEFNLHSYFIGFVANRTSIIVVFRNTQLHILVPIVVLGAGEYNIHLDTTPILLCKAKKMPLNIGCQ